MDELTPEEVRVLGVLVEKERTVPDSYPLTLISLVLGCNQSSNREPVTAYEPFEVEAALQLLRTKGLTRTVHSPSNRADKFRHVVGEALGLEDDTVTILAPMLLRGPQTVNELRTRTERYVPGVDDIEGALRILTERDLVANLGKRTGQREERWMHLLGGPVSAADLHGADEIASRPPSTSPTSTVLDRLGALEERVEVLESQLRELLE